MTKALSLLSPFSSSTKAVQWFGRNIFIQGLHFSSEEWKVLNIDFGLIDFKSASF
jgi:hypothetical protein